VFARVKPSAKNAERRAAVEQEATSALRDGRVDDALTICLKGYGDELAGYLVGYTGDADIAADAFAVGATDLWAALGQFRFQSSLRTLSYTVFRHAAARVARAPHRRAGRQVPLSQAELVSALQFQLRAGTTKWQKTSAKDAVAAMRASLARQDQELLSLRIDRGLSWLEIAAIVRDADSDAANTDAVDDGQLRKSAASLRKRFERVKAQLRRDAEAAGLVEPAT